MRHDRDHSGTMADTLAHLDQVQADDGVVRVLLRRAPPRGLLCLRPHCGRQSRGSDIGTRRPPTSDVERERRDRGASLLCDRLCRARAARAACGHVNRADDSQAWWTTLASAASTRLSSGDRQRCPYLLALDAAGAALRRDSWCGVARASWTRRRETTGRVSASELTAESFED